MKTCFFLPFLLFTTGIVAQSLEDLVQNGVDQSHFVGVVAAYQIAGEEAVMATAGLRDMDAGLAYETSTLNRIASITKTMTAVAVLQLWERDLIDLDVPIQTYLPDYPKHAEGEISVRHLLQHTSGISAYQGRETENKNYYPSLTDAAQVFQDRPLLHAPGAQESYTSYGYVVLGLIIEAVSGQTYEEYMQANIWTPAGMQHTGVEYANNRPEGLATFYYLNRRGKIKTSTPNDLSNRLPGGGLYSSAADILRFGQALMKGELIQDSTFQLMQVHPGVPYEGSPYGMGVFLYGENPAWGNVIGHGGGQSGVTAHMFLMTDQQTAVVVLCNTALADRYVGPLAVEVLKIAHQDILQE